VSSLIAFPAAAAAAGRAEPPGTAAGAPSGDADRTAAEVPVGRLAPDPEQPRCSFSEERMQALTASVRASGVIQPLLVREHPDPAARAATPYMLIVGERRWTAARRAGLATVPVVVRAAPLAPLDRLMMQLAENDGELREELALGELAAAVARAFRLAGCSQRQFAHRFGRCRPWLGLLLRLAAAEGVTGEALREGHLRGILAAHTFLRLTDFQQRRLLAEARQSGVPISVTRAEKAADVTGLRQRQRQRQAAAAGRGAAGSPATAASETAAPPLSEGAPADALPAGAGPALCPRCRAELGGPGAAGRRGATAEAGQAAVRGRRMQLLPAPPPPVPVHRPRFDGPWVTVEITGQQLETLVSLLGKKPAASHRAQVEQLLACL
jgi:ParB family transcriptional regulator, chromosome partitioning protein